MLHYFMAPISSPRKLAKINDIWQFSMNLIKIEDNCLFVWCTRKRFTECVMSTLFTGFTNICIKEPGAFPKLIILETYNCSPRYIS